MWDFAWVHSTNPVAKIASSPRRVSAAVQARTYHCHSTVDLAVCSPGMSGPLILYPTQAFSSRFTVRRLDLHGFTMLNTAPWLEISSLRQHQNCSRRSLHWKASARPGFITSGDVTSWWYKGTNQSSADWGRRLQRFHFFSVQNRCKIAKTLQSNTVSKKHMKNCY